MKHHLKTSPEYFKMVRAGLKRFEIRRNDRNFEVGDRLILQEFDNVMFTGQEIVVDVLYILDNAQYLPEGYVALSITDPK